MELHSRFIIWGFLHGTGLVFNRIWNSIFGDRLSQIAG